MKMKKRIAKLRRRQDAYDKMGFDLRRKMHYTRRPGSTKK